MIDRRKLSGLVDAIQNQVSIRVEGYALLGHADQVGADPVLGRVECLGVRVEQTDRVPVTGKDLGNAMAHQTGADHRDAFWSRHHHPAV